MKVKFLKNTNNLKKPNEPFIKNKVYELSESRAKTAIKLGFASAVNNENLLNITVCQLDNKLKDINDVEFLKSMINKDGRVTAKKAYQDRIAELLEKK